MPDQIWLECVQTELLRRKLPRQEVARLVMELSDHLSDLAESRGESHSPPAGSPRSLPPLSPSECRMSMEASAVECLGSPAQIADSALREFRKRKNLLSRSRVAAFCTFVLLPVPLLCLLWIGSMAMLFLIGNITELCGMLADAPAVREVTPIEVLACHGITLVILLVPAAGLAALFGRLSRRTDRQRLWGIAACLLVALGTGAMHSEFRFSEIPGRSQVCFGAGWHPLQIGQFLVPLAVGLLVLQRTSRRLKEVSE